MRSRSSSTSVCPASSPNVVPPLTPFHFRSGQGGCVSPVVDAPSGLAHTFLGHAANELDPKLRVMCMGSYRRGAADCGDIDLLITRDPSGDGKDHSGALLTSIEFSHHSSSPFHTAGQIHKLQKKLFGLPRRRRPGSRCY